MKRFPRLLGATALCLTSLTACGDDDPVAPKEPESARLAQQFSDMAAEAGGDEGGFRDFGLSLALQAGAAMLRAGGEIGSIQATVDGTPTTYRAISFETALGPVACQQEWDAFSDEGRPAPPCRPGRALIAWQQAGDQVSRVLFLGADSGATSFDFELPTDPWEEPPVDLPPFAFGELFDRGSSVVWISTRGSLTLDRVSTGQPCRGTPTLDPGMEVQCVVATYRHGYDLEMRSVNLDNPFQEPGTATKQIRIAPQTVPGMRMTILRLH